MIKLPTALRWLLIPTCLLGLVSRVLVPAGFMVAPLNSGWPVQPCPSKGEVFLLAGLHDSHTAEDSAGPASDQAANPHAGHSPGHVSSHASSHSSGHGSHGQDADTGHQDHRCPLGLLAGLSADLDQATWTDGLSIVGRSAASHPALATSRDAGATRARGPPGLATLDT
ncbi:MAG: hypothetical protein AAF560_28725 [Acidobacteriota bacterium]